MAYLIEHSNNRDSNRFDSSCELIRIDSIRHANRFESIRFVKKIGLSIQ